MSNGKPPTDAPPGLVLDTNVVLDWLVFGDASSRAISACLQGGHARWLACPAMEREIRHQLGKRSISGFAVDEEHALTLMESLIHRCEDPPLRPAQVPLCRDPDDQVFVDLALAGQARWLLTRDRALLALRRRLAPRGVLVVTPAQWPDVAPAGE